MDPTNERRRADNGDNRQHPDSRPVPPDTPPVSAFHAVVTLEAEAMACRFQIQFPASTTSRRAAMNAFELLEAIEQRLSVYRPDSEVAGVNASAYPGPVAITPSLMELLTHCRQWNADTDGAFDITAGPLIRAWGFLRRQGRWPTDAERDEALRRVGMRHVELDEAAGAVRFLIPGVELNFGAVGKGYALDALADQLAADKFGPVLLNAGQSSLRAVGAPPWDDAWQVDLADPARPGQRAAILRLRQVSVSTSGAQAQSFVHEGQRYGHVLDPRIGAPARGVLQATAIADSAAHAEALSTAFHVNGPAWTDAYCKRDPRVGAVLLLEPDDAAAPPPPPPPRVFGRGHVAVGEDGRWILQFVGRG